MKNTNGRKYALQPKAKTENKNHVHEDIDKHEINVVVTLEKLGTGT